MRTVLSFIALSMDIALSQGVVHPLEVGDRPQAMIGTVTDEVRDICKSIAEGSELVEVGAQRLVGLIGGLDLLEVLNGVDFRKAPGAERLQRECTTWLPTMAMT